MINSVHIFGFGACLPSTELSKPFIHHLASCLQIDCFLFLSHYIYMKGFPLPHFEFWTIYYCLRIEIERLKSAASLWLIVTGDRFWWEREDGRCSDSYLHFCLLSTIINYYYWCAEQTFAQLLPLKGWSEKWNDKDKKTHREQMNRERMVESDLFKSRHKASQWTVGKNNLLLFNNHKVWTWV